MFTEVLWTLLHHSHDGYLPLQLLRAADLELSSTKYWCLICQEWLQEVWNGIFYNIEITAKAWNAEIFLDMKNLYLSEQLFAQKTTNLRLLAHSLCSPGMEVAAGKEEMGLLSGWVAGGTPLPAAWHAGVWAPTCLFRVHLAVWSRCPLPECSAPPACPRDGGDSRVRWGTWAHLPWAAHSHEQNLLLLPLAMVQPHLSGPGHHLRDGQGTAGWGGSFQRGMCQQHIGWILPLEPVECVAAGISRWLMCLGKAGVYCCL